MQEFVGKKFESQTLEQLERALGSSRLQVTHFSGINHVQRDANCHCFAMADFVFGKLLKLMGRPMTEIQWAGRAEFERIAGGGNVLQMQLGTTVNKTLHGGRLEIA